MSRAELLNQLQGRPDIVLLMQEVQVLLNHEQNKRKEFRNLIHENIKAEFIQWRSSDALACEKKALESVHQFSYPFG